MARFLALIGFALLGVSARPARPGQALNDLLSGKEPAPPRASAAHIPLKTNVWRAAATRAVKPAPKHNKDAKEIYLPPSHPLYSLYPPAPRQRKVIRPLRTNELPEPAFAKPRLAPFHELDFEFGGDDLPMASTTGTRKLPPSFETLAPIGMRSRAVGPSSNVFYLCGKKRFDRLVQGESC